MSDFNEFRKYASKHMGINSIYMEHYIESSLTPYIIEERPLNMTQMDVFSRLMMDRIIFLGEGINDYVANIVTAQLLFLESTDRNRDVQMYINSPGGGVYAGLGIYDTMQFISPDVQTIVMGQACSMGSLLAQSGAPGKRFMLPNARHMIHQPSGGARGMASDIEISYKEITYLKKRLTEIYVQHNSAGKTYEELERDMDRDNIMTPDASVAYGLADRVITSRD